MAGVEGGERASVAETFSDEKGVVPSLRHLSDRSRLASGSRQAASKLGCAVVDLPPPHPRRWGMRMKANVVAAVRQGHFSLSEVCDRYDLSAEEYLSWQWSLDRFGLVGLRQRNASSVRDRDVARQDEPA